MHFLRRLARLVGFGAESQDPLERLAQKVEPRTRVEDLALAEPEALIRNEIVERARAERTAATIILFSGAGKTGKRETAETVAKDLGRELYVVNLSKVVSKYIGETEKNLDRLLRAAESVGAILFFDEADPLFGKRSEVKDSHDRYANIKISYLLQRLETYRGLTILAANEETLFAGVRERFGFVLDFPRGPCP